MQKIACLVERPEEVKLFADQEAQLKSALVRTYYNSDTGNFFANIQGANAYGVDIGLGDERTLNNLVKYYEYLGHFDTGFLGTDILLDVLLRKGQKDLVFKLLSSRDLGSFLYMKDRGATTVWERWHGSCSHDHPMFGACTRQLFTSILGIGQAEDTAGYKNLVICPQIPEKMQYASGGIEIETGKITVSWRKENRHISFEIQIPEGTTGVFRYGGEEWELQTGKAFRMTLAQ